ncbi:methylamine utilization protein MauE [Blastococcus colisei]|uniref:Methylamine utilization protein MauE n=1 Tax=Blastococcus colisei TaxID=1564162 RepID=A0A543PI54_9ACTN|nr:MauE/DoxX family redox-associated membrane protein [Blastococcus colisei]TQN43737.1 methylamine utilization protein MauE [Blastococcus colisei]
MRTIRPWLRTGCRAVLGIVWLVAGGLKLPDPAAAERAVRAYQLLPEPFVAPVAFGLPALEIAVGVLLLLGVFVRAAAVASAVLLGVFVAAVASAWARGLTIDCGCFGGGGQVDPGQTAYLSEIVRDLVLLVPAAVLAVWPRSRLALADRAESADDTTTGDRYAVRI